MDEQPRHTAPTSVKHRRRWYQYSLRTLLIFVTLLGCGLGWFGFKVREARQQEVAVVAIWGLGGNVVYEHEYDAEGNYVPCAAPPLPGPDWLNSLVGVDFFRNVDAVFLSDTGITDAGLERVRGLPHLRILWLNGTQVSDAGLEHLRGLRQLEGLRLSETRVTDAGLVYLQGLTQLKWLSLHGTKATAAGVAKLQATLPHCAIDR